MVVTGLILLGHRSGGHPIPLPRALLLALGLINLLGLAFLVNPKARLDVRLDYLQPIADAVPWLPGTYDIARSWPEVLHFFALSVFLISLTRICAHSQHRWTLLKVIATAGFMVSMIGIYQKASGAESMLWSNKVYEGRTFFAAFRYHGNAVAYLNLCWPASLALLLRTLRSPHRHFLATAWWSTSLLFTFGAVLVNTSKFGHLAAIPALLLALFLFRRCLPQNNGGSPLIPAVVGVLVLCSLAILSLFSAEIISSKWADAIENPVSFERRITAYEAAWRMFLDESRFLGVGPACFGLVFPYHSVFAGMDLSGTWTFAHNDYIQVIIEWGISGAAAIFFVFAGAFKRLAGRYRKSRFKSFSAAAAILALTITAVHALMDFPFQIGALQAVTVVYLAMAWAQRWPQRTEPRA
jgi:O-antigen ligase